MKHTAKAVIKTEWDFSKLYKGITDPKIEKDMKAIEQAYALFAKKYSDKKFVNSASALKDALQDYNVLCEKASGTNLWYLQLMRRLDSSNTALQAIITRLHARYIQASQQLIFFKLALADIDTKRQKQYLQDKNLSGFKYFLKVIFDNSKFKLSESEEKIMEQKQQVAHTAWTDMLSKYKDAQYVQNGKKKISLSEAMTIKSDLPRKERRELHKNVMQAYKNMSFIAEAELNAVIRNKMINDDLRGYTTPYESTIRGYENDIKSIENLVDVVTKSNNISKRFFALKAKLINQIDKSKDKKITMAELATGLSTAKNAHKKISFTEGVGIVRKAFAKAGEEFATHFDSYLAHGQIDAFPRAGKRTGAFCWPQTGAPTYVFLNYGGKLDHISTIAHEMGHAFHSDYAKTQPAIYEEYTISVAEVASTFFENILLDELIESATPEEKRDLMVMHVQDRVFTIHTQIAYFQFEKKLHKAVREKGFVSKEEIADMFAECRRSYLGDAVDVTHEDGYAYVYINHFRSFFYVYAYAYGQLIADALYAEYKKDKTFIEKIKVFFKAGGSMSPEDIFKSIGIDTAKPDFFKKGLKALEQDLAEVEKMID